MSNLKNESVHEKFQAVYWAVRIEFAKYLERKTGFACFCANSIVPNPTFEDLQGFYQETGQNVPLRRDEADYMLQKLIMKKPDLTVELNQLTMAPYYAKLRAERMKALGA